MRLEDRFSPPPPPPPPPAPKKIETPEHAIAQAKHDGNGDFRGGTHEQTISNLNSSRNTAVDTALKQGHAGDVHAINHAFDVAQVRLDAAHVAEEAKPGETGRKKEIIAPNGKPAEQTTYADGTRIVQQEGTDASGNPVVTTQLYQPGSGPAAAVPLESRSTVDNQVSSTTRLPTRDVSKTPDGKGTVITDVYGGTKPQDAERVVQHLVVPDRNGGFQVQSTTLRDNGAETGDTPPLRLREYGADNKPVFDTGEVSKITTAAIPGKPNQEAVTHVYDSGYRMQYNVNTAPAGTKDVPRTLASQTLTAPDGSVAYQQQGVTRTRSAGADGGQEITDTAANGSKQVYSTAADGRLASTRQIGADGKTNSTTKIEYVTDLPVVTRRETTTGADGRQQVTEFNDKDEPIGLKRTDAQGQVVEVQGSLKGERIETSRADDLASEILDKGDRRFRRDDFEERLAYGLDKLQDLDPVSQQMVLSKLQEKDPGMGESWFRTDILENLSPEQQKVLEQGGLDILTGVPGTTSADLQAVRKIADFRPESTAASTPGGGVQPTSREIQAGQLQMFMREYDARSGDPQAQQRFVDLYQNMHGDSLATGFLSDENLKRARDDGLSLFNDGGTVKIDQTAYEKLMGNRLETGDDKREDVLSARDRVMDAGVRRFMVDNQQQRVQTLVNEMSKLDPGGQAALMRQIAKEDPNARLNWLRDGVIDDATKDSKTFTPEMRRLMTGIRANGDTTFMGQLQGFGGGLKDAGVGFVVGLGALARTSYDLQFGYITDAVTDGNAPAFLPSAKRGAETAKAMVEGLPTMYSHVGQAWNDGRYGEAMGNVTFDVVSMVIPLKIPKIKMPGAAAAVDDAAGSAAAVKPGALNSLPANPGLDQAVISSNMQTVKVVQADQIGRLPREGRKLGDVPQGSVLVGESRSIMRDHAASAISQSPDHPLRFLINPKTDKFWTREDFGFKSGYEQIDLFDNPVLLDMGHITSNKALTNGGDRLMLQSVFENQWNNMSIERPRVGGHVVTQRAVDVDGIAVSFNDVKMWTELKVTPEMAEKLKPFGYKVGDTFLPPSILNRIRDIE